MYLSQLTPRFFTVVPMNVFPTSRGHSLQASKPAPVSEEETAAEKAAKLKAAGLQRELSQANIKVDGLTRELTKAEQRAKDADDARNRQVVHTYGKRVAKLFYRLHTFICTRLLTHGKQRAAASWPILSPIQSQACTLSFMSRGFCSWSYVFMRRRVTRCFHQ